MHVSLEIARDQAALEHQVLNILKVLAASARAPVCAAMEPDSLAPGAGKQLPVSGTVCQSTELQGPAPGPHRAPQTICVYVRCGHTAACRCQCALGGTCREHFMFSEIS